MAFPYIAAAGMAVDVVTKLAGDRSEEGFNGLNPTASAEGPITVVIPAEGQVTVEHKLGQLPQNGYSIQCKMGQGDVWDYQEPDGQHLYLETDATSDLTIKILVS